MFDFLKKKSTTPDPPHSPSLSEKRESPTPFLTRLKQGLSKTRTLWANRLATLLLGHKTLNADLLEQIETLLLTADMGTDTTQQLIQHLTQQLARNELSHAASALHALQQDMKQILHPYAIPLSPPATIKPYVILVVGVNGSGKTTTIGKLAHYFTKQHHQVMLAAGDTFRAAAIEQLQAWGHRNHTPVIAQQPGADTAAVIYDAMTAAKVRGIDILLADTAGRLHTQSGLMTELKKVKRVLAKIDPDAPHEVLLVLDASIGQNALTQVKQFHQSIGVTGIALTKLDGTAKGGMIFAIAQQTHLPIRYIGVGEQIDDLRPFQAEEFVEALFATAP